MAMIPALEDLSNKQRIQNVWIQHKEWIIHKNKSQPNGNRKIYLKLEIDTIRKQVLTSP